MYKNKKNILLVCGFDPRTIESGNEQRTNHIWKSLQKIGHVYTICYYFDKGLLDERIVCTHIVQPSGWKGLINKCINRIWRFFDIEGPKILPFACHFKSNNVFGGIHFDMVVSRYIDPVSILHLWNIAPVYVDFDDHPIESFLTKEYKTIPKYKRFTALSLRKMVFNHVTKKMVGGWLSNPQQALEFNPNKNIMPLRNIPQSPSHNYNASSERDNYLLSIGYLAYPPNYLGLDSFITDVWPSIHLKYPHLLLYIVGKNAPHAYVKKWGDAPGVKYVGYAENLEPFYQRSLATVALAQAGSGTSVKVLESLSYSRICLTTPFGTRGLFEDNKHEKGAFVFRNAQELNKLLENVVLNNSRRIDIENSSRQYIVSNYSEDSFYMELVKIFNN